MVVVAGRRPLCWSGKQLRNLPNPAFQTTTSTTIKSAAEVITKQNAIKETNQKSINLKTGDHPNKEGWTPVTGKGGKIKNNPLSNQQQQLPPQQ